MDVCVRVIDVGSEWRTFSNETSGGVNRSRVGAAEVSDGRLPGMQCVTIGDFAMVMNMVKGYGDIPFWMM